MAVRKGRKKSSPTKCLCMTKQGNPCKRNAVSGLIFAQCTRIVPNI